MAARQPENSNFISAPIIQNSLSRQIFKLLSTTQRQPFAISVVLGRCILPSCLTPVGCARCQCTLQWCQKAQHHLQTRMLPCHKSGRGPGLPCCQESEPRSDEMFRPPPSLPKPTPIGIPWGGVGCAPAEVLTALQRHHSCQPAKSQRS